MGYFANLTRIDTPRFILSIFLRVNQQLQCLCMVGCRIVIVVACVKVNSTVHACHVG